MALFAKPPALVMLAAALWLTAVDLAWAQSPIEKREQFVALVANRQNQVIANRLQQRLTKLDAESLRLLQQQNTVTAKISSPPAPPILVQINKLDSRLQQQSTRILERLQKLNNVAASSAQHATALARLRSDLTRQESIIDRRLHRLGRLERSAATPSAPGGF